MPTIDLPVHKEWRRATAETQLAKVTSEFHEVHREFAMLSFNRGNHDDAVGEIYDLIQASVGLLKVLERDWGVNLEAGRKAHLEKLIKRGVVEKDVR